MSIYNNQFLDNLENNKSREMGTPYSGNSTLTQFNRTMKREGKTVTTYTGGTEFQAFFRIKEDNENQKETIIMYYDITAPVRPGTLVMYGYGVFLALNRETVENDIYYKSVLIKCNGVFNDINGYFGNIPFYCDNMKSSVSIGNNIITTLSGNIEFITEENALSKNIKIDNNFNEFGRTFKVSNRYVIDGIVHIIAEVYADMKPTVNYSIVIDGIPASSVKVGDRVSLSATPYRNGNITTGASFDWSSDNTNVATVDGIGNVTFISDGTVNFTCTWIEKNVTKNTGAIIISSSESPTPTEKWNISIIGRNDIKWGFVRTYSIKTMLNDEEKHLDGIQYEIISNNNKLAFSVNTYDKDAGTIKLRIDDDKIYKDVIETTFTLRVYHEEKNISSSIDIDIREIM